MAYKRDAWTNEKKPGEAWFHKNSLTPRSFISLIQEGHPSLAVDGDDDNSLQSCAIMDNYYTERPTFVIDLGRVTTVGGLVIKTWQGKGQDSNFAYRDYMYGLDRYSVFVDRKPMNLNYQTTSLIDADKSSSSSNRTTIVLDNSNNNGSSGSSSVITIINNEIVGDDATADDSHYAMSKQYKLTNANSIRKRNSNANNNQANSRLLKLNEYNLCNFVTRNNYAIFTPQIHLQCLKPLTGRYIYIQADGRSNRWSRLFSAVLCEVQVYEQ